MHFSKLYSYSGILILNVFFILVLSNKEYLGRFAKVGYSSEEIPLILVSKPEYVFIDLANSNQETSPSFE